MMNDCVIYKKCAMIVIHTFPLHDQSKKEKVSSKRSVVAILDMYWICVVHICHFQKNVLHNISIVFSGKINFVNPMRRNFFRVNLLFKCNIEMTINLNSFKCQVYVVLFVESLCSKGVKAST